MSEANKALDTGQRILDAILKKFPKYVGYVRRFENNNNNNKGFVELMIKPEGTTAKIDEVTTAYSDEFFLTATKENISEKAKRILQDFKAQIGAG